MLDNLQKLLFNLFKEGSFGHSSKIRFDAKGVFTMRKATLVIKPLLISLSSTFSQESIQHRIICTALQTFLEHSQYHTSVFFFIAILYSKISDGETRIGGTLLCMRV